MKRKSSLPYRGVIEGFYGPLWTHDDRLDLLANMPAWNMNLYIYAPKNDPYHRFRWELPYPRDEMRKFRELSDAAQRRRVMLSIAISPGNTFDPKRNHHRRLLMKKIGQFIDVGCAFFPILYDDLQGFTDFQSPQAALHAEAQARFMNDLAEQIRGRVPKARFLFCPTQYGTAEKSPYLTRLHELLDRSVEVVVTGVDGPGYQVFAHTFSNRGAEEYIRNFGRKPFLWDNFSTSDWTLNELHWSPYSGRGDRLDELCSGIVINPQNLHAINRPVFGTMGAYFANPRRYDPAAAMKTQLVRCLGPGAAKPGLTLSKWYTNEISGYVSSAINLPDLERLGGPAGTRNKTLRLIKQAVAPTLNFADIADFTPMPPEYAGHLSTYCHMLKW